jgi:hypothetical protein
MRDSRNQCSERPKVPVRLVGDGTAPTGAASELAAGGLSLLHPEEQVFDAMLTGWRNQQLARRLAFSTVEQRERMVRAFAVHSQSYPWLWTAQLVDEWMTDLRGVRASTLRGYQIALRLFCAYATDSAYAWPTECEQRFGTHPVQVVHEWNTAVCRSYDLTCRFRCDLTCRSSARGSWHGFTPGDQREPVFEAVAGAVDADDVAVVQEPVEDRGGQDVVAEDLSPFGEALVAGDDHRAAFVAAADALEDHVRFGVRQGQVADFVDLCGCPHRSTYADSATMPSLQARRP